MRFYKNTKTQKPAHTSIITDCNKNNNIKSVRYDVIRVNDVLIREDIVVDGVLSESLAKTKLLNRFGFHRSLFSTSCNIVTCTSVNV